MPTRLADRLARPLPDARRWSTEGVGAGARLDYWVGVICEAFLEMDASSQERRDFGGALTSVPFDGIALNYVDASQQDVFRSRRAIARSRDNFFYLVTQSESAWHMRQHGLSPQLRAGDAVLFDSREPYELHFPTKVDTLSVQIPRDWLVRWLPEPERCVARVLPRDAGWSSVLCGFLRNLDLRFAQAPGLPPALLTEHLGLLLDCAFGELDGRSRPVPPGASANQHAGDPFLSRVHGLLRQRLGEASLTAGDVAVELGLSVRSLQRAMADRGTAFAVTLQHLRLQEAARLLASRSHDRLTVAEIGRRCGFTDASHFGRAFVARHGATPAAWRRRMRGA